MARVRSSVFSPTSLTLVGLLSLAATVALAAAPTVQAPGTVQFNRDVRPILSDVCYKCHGPDSAQRKAGLRLDDSTIATALRNGKRAIAPGDPGHSDLLTRITAPGARRMPPPESGLALTPAQIDTLRRWIAQGAKYERHWSFLPPKLAPIPNGKWQMANGKAPNPIDAFVWARLERAGLKPSPEADRATLIRRVSLDLTGLPPTPEEVDAFVADRSPNAYEKIVDRLLASPRYGERMARPWLDAARYADSNGYQSDGERTMWRWRDWVIDAFNADMPFDQFTIEQLAGDLLPNPTVEQRIATGFNRNHRGNGEGGIIPEEYQCEYVVDRVETTATVWLGLTLGCSRCHDHKFDALSQKDFYRFFAFFNNIPERGRANKYGNSPPLIPAPTREQQAELAALDARITGANEQLARLQGDMAASQAGWEQSGATRAADWTPTEALSVHLNGENLSTAVAADAPSTPPGIRGRAMGCDGKRFLDAGDKADYGFYDAFTLAAWVRAEGPKGGTIVSRMTDVPRGPGYSLVLVNGKLQANFVMRWLDDSLRMETAEPIGEGWHHVAVSYDGSRVASGVTFYVDGKPAAVKINLDELNQTFQVKETLRIGAGHGPEGRFHGDIDEVTVYKRVLTDEEAAILATRETVAEIAAMPASQRGAGQRAKIRDAFLATAAPQPVRDLLASRLSMVRERERLLASYPTSMVMEEMPLPRKTHLLLRGQYDKPGEVVTSGVPAALPPLPNGVAPSRLALARWLVDGRNPLTARVAVNRVWQLLFGAGLVRTVEDFGAQGMPPTHPELLDHLAALFSGPKSQVPSPRGNQDGKTGKPSSNGKVSPTPNTQHLTSGLGWSTKALIRLIVTSATYKQSSRATPAILAKDPENKLLARGARQRLSAEMIRDQALATSGLLAEKIGGPSVRPYQPDGLIKDLDGTSEYAQDHGPNLYRRGMYTFWKRTVAPPQMVAFDAGGREYCVVRETRTNTPLQALTLLNEVSFVEASRVLAEKAIHEAGPQPEERVRRVFRRVLGRQIKPDELRVLTESYTAQLEDFRKQPEAAKKLISTGETPRDEKLDLAEHAALTTVASLILNLDEAITKE